MNPADITATASPVRGVVAAVTVQVGDTVSVSTRVAVIEFLDMRHIVPAGAAGQIITVAVEIGDTVDVSQTLVVIEPRPAAATTAIDDARHDLSFFTADIAEAEPDDQRLLRHLVPENRLRPYNIRPIIDGLCDPGTVSELRGGFGVGIVTALARIEGVPIALLANDSRHLGGAIDAEAADKATAFLQLCDAHRLPIISLCDTPGFVARPDAEKAATARRFRGMFQAGAKLSVPIVLVVLRKAYGLGAMAMAGGDMRAPIATMSWPTGEFGGMGLDCPVRIGYRTRLDADAGPAEHEGAYQSLVTVPYEPGKALNIGTAFKIDAVIDPADTRATITAALTHRRLVTPT